MAQARGQHLRWLVGVLAAALLFGACEGSGSSGDPARPSGQAVGIPAPPKPEPIDLVELPVPPTAPSADEGSCTPAVNPRGTGCIASVSAGNFLDNDTVLATFTYAGAPAAPAPASIYTGSQLAMIKTGGVTFPGGDAWKCITCGIPAENRAGASSQFDWAQPFRNGSRILAGNNIVDCGQHRILDPGCTPEALHVYPVRWGTTADESGGSGMMIGLKLNPDNVHVGWNRVIFPATADDMFGELAYYGTLTFNPNPSTGEPRTPRYDITNITGLYSSDEPFGTFLRVDPANPAQLVRKQAHTLGEFKGWTGDGQSALGIANFQSANLDHVATNLTTGETRRIDGDPGYSDPISSSADGKWSLEMDVRYQDRFYFLTGLPGVPPITDLLPTGAAISAGYNIHDRRLFQPFLIDQYGPRDGYNGQQINTCRTGSCSTLAAGPGSGADDPLWGSRADSAFSPDGTKITYWQAYPSAENCGPAVGDPATCPPSSEPGGRTSRLMLAELTSRTPQKPPAVSPLPDTIPWGTPYQAGDPAPALPHIPAGDYTLKGKASGRAAVKIAENATKTGLASISVTYTDFSDDGVNTVNGTESVQNAGTGGSDITFHANLTLTGQHTGTKRTSEPGGYTVSPRSVITNIYKPTGTMTTVLDGRAYHQPKPY